MTSTTHDAQGFDAKFTLVCRDYSKLQPVREIMRKWFKPVVIGSRAPETTLRHMHERLAQPQHRRQPQEISAPEIDPASPWHILRVESLSGGGDRRGPVRRLKQVGGNRFLLQRRLTILCTSDFLRFLKYGINLVTPFPISHCSYRMVTYNVCLCHTCNKVIVTPMNILAPAPHLASSELRSRRRPASQLRQPRK